MRDAWFANIYPPVPLQYLQNFTHFEVVLYGTNPTISKNSQHLKPLTKSATWEGFVFKWILHEGV